MFKLNIYISTIVFMMVGNLLFAERGMSGVYTVGSVGNFPTLKAFFDSVNVSVVDDTIYTDTMDNITDTSNAVLNAVNYNGDLKPIRIYSSSGGFVISGNISDLLIDLNGVDYVIFDLSGVYFLRYTNEATTQEIKRVVKQYN